MIEDDWTTEDMRSLHDNIFGRYFRPRFDRWLAQHDAEVAKAKRERIIALLESKKDDYYQRNLWADGDGIADAIALINGEVE